MCLAYAGAAGARTAPPPSSATTCSTSPLRTPSAIRDNPKMTFDLRGEGSERSDGRHSEEGCVDSTVPADLLFA